MATAYAAAVGTLAFGLEAPDGLKTPSHPEAGARLTGRLKGLAGPLRVYRRRRRQSPPMPSGHFLVERGEAHHQPAYSSLIDGDMFKRGVDRLREPKRRTCTSCFHVRLVQHGSAAMPKPPRRDLRASAIAP